MAEWLRGMQVWQWVVGTLATAFLIGALIQRLWLTAIGAAATMAWVVATRNSRDGPDVVDDDTI